MSYSHTYARYLASLPREAKCACGNAPIGKCRVCSEQPKQEELRIDHNNQQLRLFPDTNDLYHNER